MPPVLLLSLVKHRFGLFGHYRNEFGSTAFHQINGSTYGLSDRAMPVPGSLSGGSLNPLTGQTVESKGGNNRLFGAWKAQFGHEEVESWMQLL